VNSRFSRSYNEVEADRPRVYRAGKVWIAERTLVPGQPLTRYTRIFKQWREAIEWATCQNPPESQVRTKP